MSSLTENSGSFVCGRIILPSSPFELQKRNPSVHRPNPESVSRDDSVETLPDESEIFDEPESLEQSQLPVLDVVHVHDEAVESANEQELSGQETTQLIRSRQEENHSRAKRRSLDGLKNAVLPQQDEDYRKEKPYYDSVIEQIDTVFSTDAEAGNDSRLEVEYREVVRIESIRDRKQRDTERARYIDDLATRLNARPKDAEAVYYRMANSLDDFRGLQKQRQAILLIEHDPDSYEEFIQLTERGDHEGIARLFESIESRDLREELQSLRRTELMVEQVIDQREADLMESARQTFGASVSDFETFSPDRQLLLGSIADSASTEFLEIVRAARMNESSLGLEGMFLGRPLIINDS